VKDSSKVYISNWLKASAGIFPSMTPLQQEFRQNEGSSNKSDCAPQTLALAGALLAGWSP
jgi:hypothetical protein